VPRIVAISDTHCQMGKVKLPDGDILIHAGDLTNRGSIRETSMEMTILNQLADRFKHVIYVAGNHDWLPYMDRNVASSLLGRVQYLEDSMIEVEGLRIYGSPWTPLFMDWAFMLPRQGEAIRAKWDKIPDGVDVLVTHGPAYGILDQNPQGFAVGCEQLTSALSVMAVPPKHHIFGHIHDSYGTHVGEKTKSYNVAVCNERYQPLNKPTVIEV